MPFWDLRNYFDPRSYKRKGHFDLPLPNYVGVSGEVTKNMYLSSGYPQQDLVEVEALRFLYLDNFSSSKKIRNDNGLKNKVILVTCDYHPPTTHSQLNVLSLANKDIDQSIRFIIKPHPACPINMMDFPGLRGELSSRPIQELMKICDVVYTSLVTSAAVDAYCAGLPVITFLDGKTLNLSPLRGTKGVHFVTNSKSLAKAVNTLEVADSNQKKNYFYLDSGLSYWYKWLTDNSDIDK